MIGLVARCDNGGLGALTWEFYRHLHPERTLVVWASDRPNGRAHPERYDHGNVRFCPRHPTRADVMWLLRGVSTVYSAETWYLPQLPAIAARMGVRTILHVMPEFHVGQRADELWVPTPWNAPPDATVVPVPVASEHFTDRTPAEVRTLYHIASPDVYDRNGTRLLLDAARRMRTPARILIREHTTRPWREQHGEVTVVHVPHHDGPYHEAWTEHPVDALIMPRAYAGLSLPMQEAATQHLPVLTLDRDPEHDWFPWPVPAHIDGTIQATSRARPVNRYTTNPNTLAQHLDHLCTTNPAARITATRPFPTWNDMTPEYEQRLRCPPS